MSNPVELAIVMPVYNEQASIQRVVEEWFREIEKHTQNFVFLVVNDGSKDNTLTILRQLAEKLGPRLEIVDKANSGHGPTCLIAYREVVRRGIPYLLQLDSDGQCVTDYFPKFWAKREACDVVYGVRLFRADGMRRIIASMVLRLYILFLFQRACADANVPYRLMRTEKIAPYLQFIPDDLFLCNSCLSILLRGDASIRHGYVSIHFPERYGGESTVKMSMFSHRAIEFYGKMKQIIKAARNVASQG